MKIEGDIYVHTESAERVTHLLEHIITQLNCLTSQESHIMADVTSIKKLVSDMNDETNAIATKQDAEIAEIKRLTDLVASGGTVTEADLQSIQDGLQPLSDRLKSLGADPTHPIPPAV